MSFEKIQTQLSQRVKDSMSSLFTPNSSDGVQFLLACNDIGVARNGGRRGARYAPEALLAAFKKMTCKKDSPKWDSIVVSELSEDELSFKELQNQECSRITLDLNKINIHLGGGHDHIYPLLIALSKNHQKITVINIDAHLDTRTDQYFHSGTPFRQFSNDFEGDFKLLQVGIHAYSNAQSNYENLKGMEILSIADLLKYKPSEDEIIVFSLDCDALNSNIMKAVSAVNHDGLSRDEFYQCYDFYKQIIKHPPIIGIYEYNPLFDDVSGSSARFLSSFIYNAIH